MIGVHCSCAYPVVHSAKKPFTRCCLALLVLSLALTGCFESDQKTVLFADGSGKHVWTVGGPLDKHFDDPKGIVKFMDTTKGIVAWAEPKIVKENDWVKVTMVAYFEDINAVKFGSFQGEVLSWEYVKDGDGGTLTMVDPISKSLQASN